MGRVYKTANKKVMWSMGILILILFVFLVYRNLQREDVYANISFNQSGLMLQIYGGEENNSLCSCAVWFCSGLSILFLLIRLWRNLKVRNRETEELILSYPVSRRQMIKREILYSGYGLFLCICTMLVFIGLWVIELVKTVQLQKQLGSYITVSNVSIQLLLYALLILALQLFFIAWHYFCEIVTRERMLGYFLGMFGMVGMVGLYNGILWADLQSIPYMEYTNKELLLAGGIVIAVFLLAILLFVIDVKLYEKIDYSKGGLFYFKWAKDFFVCVACLFLMLAGGVFDRELQGESRGLLVVVTAVLLMALNYITLSDTERKSSKRVLLENGKGILILGVLSMAIYTGQTFLLQSQEGETMPEEVRLSNEECRFSLEDEETYEQFRQTIRREQPDILLPELGQGWEFQRGNGCYLSKNAANESGVWYYDLSMENTKGEWFAVHFDRRYNDAWTFGNCVELKNLQITSEKENEIRLIQHMETGGISITVYQFDKGKDACESYSFYGNITEEKMLALVEKFMG